MAASLAVEGSSCARLLRVLGCRYPIVQGGMTSVGTARLAAAVSNAGGLGLVSAGRMTVEAFGTEIDRALELARQPIGVNIPITREAAWLEAAIDAALARPIHAVFLGGGNPAPWAERIVAAGKVLALVVASVRQAVKAEALGASLVVAEGMEAGGKAAYEEVGTVALIPAVSGAVDLPVVAAGGIADGRGLAAALSLGAAGVQMGTRFIVSRESPVHEATKQAMVAATIDDTLIVGRRHGLNRRVLRNRGSEKVRQREIETDLDEMLELLAGHNSVRGLLGGDASEGMIACGQGVGVIREVLSVAEIVEQTMAEARRALKAADRALEASAPPLTLDVDGPS